MRWLAVLALAVLLLLVGWLTGNVFFIHPDYGTHHAETLADLQCTPQVLAGSFSLLCLFSIVARLYLPASPHSSEAGACRFFRGWHSSAYDEAHTLQERYV